MIGDGKWVRRVSIRSTVIFFRQQQQREKKGEIFFLLFLIKSFFFSGAACDCVRVAMRTCWRNLIAFFLLFFVYWKLRWQKWWKILRYSDGFPAWRLIFSLNCVFKEEIYSFLKEFLRFSLKTMKKFLFLKNNQRLLCFLIV